MVCAHRGEMEGSRLAFKDQTVGKSRMSPKEFSTVDLSWSATNETDKYEVYLDLDDPHTADPLSTKIGTTTVPTLEDVGPLQSGKQYKWRVRSLNDCQPTDSPIWYFVTE